MVEYDNITSHIYSLIETMEFSEQTNIILYRCVIILFIAILAVVSDYVSKWLINNPLKKLAQKTRNKFDDYIFERKLPARIANIVPAFVVYFMLPMAFSKEMFLYSLLEKMSLVYIVATIMRAFGGFIKALSDMAQNSPRIKNRPLKGLFQTIQVIIIFIGIIIIIAILVDKSPATLIAGLGASAAILSLVFKDSLLGLISGIQLSWNDMLRPGDWITMPSKNIDGVVFEVSLNTVKIRNFDNTILTIPPMMLMTDSFQNWRGMTESPGRRIMRSVNIDMYSVGFADEALTARVSAQYPVIDEYVRNRTEEDKKRGECTNLKLFRVYMEWYLRNLPDVAKSETLMVRYLAATTEGIPMQVYFFSSNKVWEYYEAFAADVIEHLLAVIPQFDLRIYQRASGVDMRNMGHDDPTNKMIKPNR
ncbi:MAG: mechanosensitive ion channel [Bacteroidetes bacterium]|uniref:Mechanosensitive ion channel n=1 Tax=Candidatus Caccoplasma merdipullorum TaxID=2840718 RepID=A0A9D9E498_9BACT|nr:mechanosensitive ion channel [Candidatus Caccoplasma merdipullorum]